MRRYLLDTGIAQDFVNSCHGVRERVDEARKKGHRIGICIPVLGELWSGVEGSASRELNLQRLKRSLSRLYQWPFSAEAAEEYGRIFVLLRRAGRPMQQVDIQIAAIAVTLANCTVVSRDSDFLAIPGLTVENWPSMP